MIMIMIMIIPITITTIRLKMLYFTWSSRFSLSSTLGIGSIVYRLSLPSYTGRIGPKYRD